MSHHLIFVEKAERLLYRLGKKLEQLKYLNRTVVFGTDIVLSIFSSYISYQLVTGIVLSHREQMPSLGLIMLLSMIASTIAFLLFRLYEIIIRLATFQELLKFLYASIAKSVIVFTFLFVLGWMPLKACLIYSLMEFLITSVWLSMSRALLVNLYYSIIHFSRKDLPGVAICGIGSNSVSLSSRLSLQHGKGYTPVAFVIGGRKRQNVKINGLPVLNVYSEASLRSVAVKYGFQTILFASPGDVTLEKNRLVDYSLKLNFEVLVVPHMEKEGGGAPNRVPMIREVEIEDLLGRAPIKRDAGLVEDHFSGKKVLVTGAAGSIGSEICEQLLTIPIDELIVLDIAETPLHNLKLTLTDKFPNHKIHYILGNVCSKEQMDLVLKQVKPQIIFHAAAYKHVPIVEDNPCEAVLVNILGTKNLAEAAIAADVEQFVMISTDKAVRPTNVMGATKRIAEMLAQSLNKYGSSTRFVTTRFGNVLGSNGSVIPLFREQIRKGGPVTVTHPDIYRYFMTIPEACNLVLEASSMGKGGEVFVFDMGEQVRIADMAERMIALSGFEPGKDIEIVYTGLRPGEKLYEELLTDAEETMETCHGKIRMSTTLSPSYEFLVQQIAELVQFSKAKHVEESVKLMKQIVPDFISNNSCFEKLDKELNNRFEINQ